MKVVGIGLNKTGTKTLKHCLTHWGMNHQSYDLKAFQLFRDGKIEELLSWMEEFDSFEDWPWPLFYREIDERFPDAKFILTTRLTPDRWYQSLCKMAVRMGPFKDYERHIYGHAMPQGKREEHIRFYERHNEEVEGYFADRPHKLLKLCWEDGDNNDIRLASFLGCEPLKEPIPRINKSVPVYGGDNLWIAQLSRIVFQTKWKVAKILKNAVRKVIPARR